MVTIDAARGTTSEDVDAVTEAVLAASRLLMALSAQSIAAVDETVTAAQFRLMVVLHTGGPMKLTAIADILGVNPSTATRMVDRMVAAGLVSREANPASRRELIVDLTPTGREEVREVMRRRRALIRQIVRRMPPTTQRGLVRALNAFIAAGGQSSVGDDRPESLWF